MNGCLFCFGNLSVLQQINVLHSKPFCNTALFICCCCLLCLTFCSLLSFYNYIYAWFFDIKRWNYGARKLMNISTSYASLVKTLKRQSNHLRKIRVNIDQLCSESLVQGCKYIARGHRSSLFIGVGDNIWVNPFSATC